MGVKGVGGIRVDWPPVVGAAVIASADAAMLLTINNPDVFQRPNSPWSAVLEGAVDYLAIVVALVFMRRY